MQTNPANSIGLAATWQYHELFQKLILLCAVQEFTILTTKFPGFSLLT